MKAWKINDEQWMAQRRADWKNIKFSLDNMYAWNSEEIALIKNYYLYGDTKDSETPINNIRSALLLELWLNADTSMDNFYKVLEQYQPAGSKFQPNNGVTASRQDFMPEAQDFDIEYKGDKSFFSGLEEKLYLILAPNKFTRDDYPRLNEKRFIKEARSNFLLINGFYHYFHYRKVNPFNITKLRVSYWKGTIKLGYHERREFPWMIYFVEDALKAPDTYQEHQVNLAKELIEVLDDQTISDAFTEGVEEARNKLENDKQVQFEIKRLLETRN